MSQFQLIDTITCANILGEGVQWNHQDQSVWWTDIHAAKLHRYCPVTKEMREWSTPEPVGCFAFVEGDDRLLLALASGFAWFELASGRCQWIARPELSLAGNRFNDGRVDRQGRFWAGTVVEQQLSPRQTAALYCLDQAQTVTQHLPGLAISNSLCWSPDSRKLYHANSPTYRIQVYDFDAPTGTLSNPQTFVELPSGIEPDGACIDAEGYLWSAQWGGGRVVRYTPEGIVDRILNLPVTQPTCVALGGPEMNWLFITSARKGLSKAQLATQPLAGSLFIYQTPVKGLAESWYRPD
jgi:L-arabinonolactonase